MTPPVWTDEHIEELNNDFYLIPKEIVDTLLWQERIIYYGY